MTKAGQSSTLAQPQSGLLGNPFQDHVFLQSKVKNDTRNKGHGKVGPSLESSKFEGI